MNLSEVPEGATGNFKGRLCKENLAGQQDPKGMGGGHCWGGVEGGRDADIHIIGPLPIPEKLKFLSTVCHLLPFAAIPSPLVLIPSSTMTAQHLINLTAYVTLYH